ncbi:MAG: hypothetical protein J5958_05910 [Clostridia bacterium]|nr:hypothetical protein [Clostridia bacterium]MBR5044506.1 hypothetical protein [Clostridia bacterium]
MNGEERIRDRIARVVEIANTDPEGQKLAHKLANGKLLVKVGDELEIPVRVSDGTLTVVKDSSHPKAVCEFSDAETAWALLTASMSPYVATVHRLLDQRGLSPMNETFEKIWLLAHERLDAKN